MGRPAPDGWRPGARELSDILGGHGVDPELLAEIYDLEHDAVTEDLAFYREMARRAGRAVLDLGCGSGRLFASFLAGGATRVTGIDGAPALVARAQARIAREPALTRAAAAGRLQVLVGDVRRPPPGLEGHDLAVLAGVLAHLDGPEEALRALTAAAERLAPGGLIVVDGLGPGGLPETDLPLSVDWRRRLGGREVVRRSELRRRETPEGLRVAFSTIVDLAQPDGTIARLPASYRLWYSQPRALCELVGTAGFETVGVYGSHDLDPLDGESDRCIIVGRRIDSEG